jgi:DNA modification methylase
MTGQSHLEEVLHNLSTHLSYQWALAYFTPGSSVQVFGRKIKSNWKPVIFLTKGKNEWEHIDDVIWSDKEDKEHHKWGQSVTGMISLIEKFTTRNQIVLDPFCGAGTTGVACLLRDRHFIGSDISKDEIEKTKERLLSL